MASTTFIKGSLQVRFKPKNYVKGLFFKGVALLGLPLTTSAPSIPQSKLPEADKGARF
jgi:hypothetical protein